MSTMIREIYDALKEAGVSEEKAAAAAVAARNGAELATKVDLKTMEAEVKVEAQAECWRTATRRLMYEHYTAQITRPVHCQ